MVEPAAVEMKYCALQWWTWFWGWDCSDRFMKWEIQISYLDVNSSFSFIWYSILFHFTSLYKQTHEPTVLVPERGSALDPNGDKLLAYNIMRNDPMLLTFMCLWVQFILSRAHVLHGVHNSKKQKPLQVSTSQISIQFWKFLMISRQMIWAIWLNKEMPMEVKSVFYYVFFFILISHLLASVFPFSYLIFFSLFSC